jgi:peptidoglycan/LPS O-acetylase OafA/YrhL
MEKFFSLQILRAVASTLVLVYHTRGLIAQHFDSTPFPSLFERGDRGVDLFFVLSGFIMTHVHFRDIGKPERYSGYLYSRVTRIYPFVWIVSIWAVVVYWAGFNPSKFEKLEFWPLVDSVMLLPQSGDPLVGVTWTLKYEIFFYAIFGLLILSRQIGLVVLIGWQAAILFLALARVPTGSLWAYYFREIALEFGVGCLAALLVMRHARSPNGSAPVWSTLALLIGCAAFLAMMQAEVSAPQIFAGAPRFLTYGLSAGLIIVGCCLLERRGVLPTPKALVFLGDASFAIYLVHYGAISLALAAVARLHVRHLGEAASSGLAIFGVAAGLGFYFLAERPITRQLAARRRALRRYPEAAMLGSVELGGQNQPAA